MKKAQLRQKVSYQNIKQKYITVLKLRAGPTINYSTLNIYKHLNISNSIQQQNTRWE
jgi:hypothetical protein